MITLEFAGVTFRFPSALPIACQDDTRIFSRSADGPCDFSYEVVEAPLPPFPEESPFYQDTLTRVWRSPEENRVYYRLPNSIWSFCLLEQNGSRTVYVVPERSYYVKNVWNVLDKVQFSSRLLEKGAVMLHSSYIIHEGRAILFTAASGVGKSTQAELWRKTLGAEIINGDRSLIRRKDGQLWAFGCPFSGSSGICRDRSAPIRAIVTLEQGPENTIRTLTRRECTRFFLAQTTILRWKAEDVIATMELWDSFIQAVPVLRLSCRPDADAVYTLKEYLDSLDAKEF